MIIVGINKNPSILKNNVIHNPQEFPERVKNNTQSKNKWSKKKPNIFNGEKGIFLKFKM